MSTMKQQDKGKPGETRKRIDIEASTSFNEEENEYICSSSYHGPAVVIQPKALKQKLIIATNILNECKLEKKKLAANSPECRYSLLQRLILYTNLPEDELKQINNTVRTRDRTFEKALKDIKTIPWPTRGFLRDDIRSIIFKNLVEKLSFPSKIDLLKDLNAHSIKYTREIIPIHRLIKNKLIKYQHFPEFNRYLLMEHPKTIYHRTMYLKKIQGYRTQGRSFVYVEVRRISPRCTSTSFIAGLAAFVHDNKTERFFTKDTNDMTAQKWLQQRVLPYIPQGSVVVFSQPKKFNKLTPLAKKADIISWLEDYGIPYGQGAHTAELYHLYERFRSKVTRSGVYDHVFLNVGLELILCPEEWPSINYFQDIWKVIEVMDTYHTGRPEVLKRQILDAAETFTDLKAIEAVLIGNECKMQKADSRMEEIVENVLEAVKAGEVQIADFPRACCADKTDRAETHVADIVWD